MAMTLRLSDDDDRALSAAAQREGLSKHEVVLRAVRAYTGDHRDQVLQAARRVAQRDANLLRRLGE